MVNGGRGTLRACRVGIRRGVLLLVLALSLLSSLGYAATYVYDANGRLRAVTASTGESAEYVYDKLGNLLAVDRIPAGQLSIFTFMPNHGPAGTTVTISGQGFSTTPANNLLAFNGTPATVASATATQLVATVPAGATTGPISITVGANSASSLEDFIVSMDGGGQLPTITSFSPAVSESGTTVTVVGSHFAASSGPIQAGIQGFTSFVAPTSDTQVEFQVPSQARSGFVTVINAYGSAQSARPLIVVPASVGAANVTSSANLDVDGGSQALSIAGLGKYAAMTFSATSGESLGLGISGLVAANTANPASGYALVTVYKPDMTVWVSNALCYVTNGGCDLNLANVPATGIYTVLARSQNGDSSLTLSFTATMSHDITMPLTAGVPLGVSLNRYGQNARLSFAGTAGMSGGVQVAATSTTPAGRRVGVTVMKPDGSTLVTGIQVMGGALQIPMLPVSGTYTVFVDPEFGVQAALSVRLVTPDGGGVVVDGASQTVTGSTSAYFAFAATAGENLGVGISNLLKQNGLSSYNITVFVYLPNGARWDAYTKTCYIANGCDLNLANVPISGMYGVLLMSGSPIDESDMTLSYTATVSHDIATPLAAGVPLNVSLSRYGQNARLPFTGTAGMSGGVQVAATSTTPAGRRVGVTVVNPDGSTLVTGIQVMGGALQIPTLPVSGTYAVFVDPEFGVQAELSVRLVTPDGGGVVVDGASQTVTGSTSAYFAFAATAGENLGVGISNLLKQNGLSSYNYVAAFVYLPNGARWDAYTKTCYIANGCDLNLANVPISGMYGVLLMSASPIDESDMTLSYTATVSHDVATPLAAGVPLNVSLSRYGQNARLPFTGTAGMSGGVQVAATSTTPAGRRVGVTVVNPDGSILVTGIQVMGGALQIPTLPVSGTYAVLADPEFGVPAELSVRLVTPDGGGVVVDGASQTVTGSTSAYFAFAATAGENLRVRISNLLKQNGLSSYNYVAAFVYLPNGARWDAYTKTCYIANGCDLNLANVPTSGMYGVLLMSASPIDEPGMTLSYTATVSHDVATPLAAGIPLNVSLNRYGQNTRLSFTGTAGQTTSLAVSGITTTPANSAINLVAQKPDGTTFASASQTASVTFNLENLPTTRTYTLLVDPSYGSTVAPTATVTP